MQCKKHLDENTGNALVVYCLWCIRYMNKNLSSYLCLFLYVQTHTTAASTIIPMSTTPPTAPPTAVVISTLSVAGPTVVGLAQSACATNELISIGQLGYTSVMLPWTRIDLWPPLTHCLMYNSTCAQSECPDSCARYKTTCWSLVQRKCSELIWFTVNEHWHLELTADIMELVISASVSLVA